MTRSVIPTYLKGKKRMIGSKTIANRVGRKKEILFVGEAGGMQEELNGICFIGSAGKFLMSCLRDRTIDICIEDANFDNVFNRRPHNNKVEHFFSSKETVYKSLSTTGEMLLAQFKKRVVGLSPNLIVALGETAMFYLTGKSKVTDHRGSMYPCLFDSSIKVLCTFHPAHILYSQEAAVSLLGEKKKEAMNALPLFLLDLQKAKREMSFRELLVTNYNFDISLSSLEIIKKLNSIKEGIIGIDIETIFRDHKVILWLLSIATSKEEAFTIRFLKNRVSPLYSVEEEALIIKALSDLFLRSSVKKVFHNGNRYDLQVLFDIYGLRLAEGTYEDSMWAFHATFPSLPKSLQVVTSLLTHTPYYKGEGASKNKYSTDSTEAVYCCKDACCSLESYSNALDLARRYETYNTNKETPHIKNSGYVRSMNNMESLLYMQSRGVKVDLAERERLYASISEQMSEIENKMEALIGESLVTKGGGSVLRSPKELSRILYRKLGLSQQISTLSKRLTTDKTALTKLSILHPDNEFLALLRKHRNLSVLLSTFITMKLSPSNRMHTSYGYTNTWRLTSSVHPMGYGGNMQNLPKSNGKYIRRILIPDEGKIFVVADLSQAEARVVSWEAKDEKAIDDFLSGGDVHWLAAVDMLPFLKGFNYSDSTKNTVVKEPDTGHALTLNDARNIAKIAVHGGNYLGGAGMIQKALLRLEILRPITYCRDLIIKRLNSRPAIKIWHKKIWDKLNLDNTIISSFGRKRLFFGKIDNAAHRVACAFSPQNTVGEILESGIASIHKKQNDLILMNIHDEVVCQCDDNEASVRKTASIINEALSIPLLINGRELIIPVDISIGHNYCDLKAYKL